MNVQPYLYFHGRAEEAMQFYAQAIGAEQVFLMRFRESPDPSTVPPGAEDKVMHATFRVGDSEIDVSDGLCDESKLGRFEGISLTLRVSTTDQAERCFAALGEGGQVQMPMTETFFSPRFGMVQDKFGVSWLVLAETENHRK